MLRNRLYRKARLPVSFCDAYYYLLGMVNKVLIERYFNVLFVKNRLLLQTPAHAQCINERKMLNCYSPDRWLWVKRRMPVSHQAIISRLIPLLKGKLK